MQLGGEVTLWQGQGRVNHTAVAKQLQVAIDIFGFDRICFEGNWFFNNWSVRLALCAGCISQLETCRVYITVRDMQGVLLVCETCIMCRGVYHSWICRVFYWCVLLVVHSHVPVSRALIYILITLREREDRHSNIG